jgi:hypothetical protein
MAQKQGETTVKNREIAIIIRHYLKLIGLEWVIPDGSFMTVVEMRKKVLGQSSPINLIIVLLFDYPLAKHLTRNKKKISKTRFSFSVVTFKNGKAQNLSFHSSILSSPFVDFHLVSLIYLFRS